MWTGGKAVLAAASLGMALIAGATGAAAATLTLHTAPFLLKPEKQLGFEGEIKDLAYSENGIDVTYVGYGSEVWASSQAAEGLQSWYVNGGGFGYTRIQLGETVEAFQFAAATGWPPAESFGRGIPQPRPAIQFRLLNGGVQVAEGLFPIAPNYSGFGAFGFSGIQFDEVHIQSQLGEVPFDEGGFDAIALDALAFGGPVGRIPEPATWAMMILGFGIVGISARRQTPRAA